MPGLTDWFDVFRCGTHLDHSGTWRTFSEADIDKAIASYQSDSAPIVVGHPTLNAPAFGWIQQFRRQGPVLQARCSRVADEFSSAVQRGLYKNRSISFNSDGTFRHVGFLGAAAPAVKGLEEIQFTDKGDYITMDATTDKADAEPVQLAPENTSSEAAPESQAAPAEQEVKEPKVLLPDIGSQQLQTTVKELESKIKSLENALNVEQTKNRKAEFAAYADDLIRDGRLNPVAKAPLVSTMEAMYSSDQACFAAPENSVLNTFKGFLNMALPKNRCLFAEFAAGQIEPSISTPKDIAGKARALIDDYASRGIYLDVGRAVQMTMKEG